MTENTSFEVLSKSKSGRKLAAAHFESVKARTGRILQELGIEDHVCLMTFGSCGSWFWTGISDTDFTFLTDGKATVSQIAGLQERLLSEFEGNPYDCSFKEWTRLKVNAMDVLSLRYLCGNYKVFMSGVVNNPEFKTLVTDECLVTLLTGNDLHIEFMASHYFSRLLNRYHSVEELPVPISFGDVKFYLGGMRSAQFIYMVSMLHSGKKFLYQVDMNARETHFFLTDDEFDKMQDALDFLLSAKDLCVEGCNIFHTPNLNRIMERWNETPKEIKAQYVKHTSIIRDLCAKAHDVLMKNYSDFIGVTARSSLDPEKLLQIINSDSLELWRTIALRRDLPQSLRLALAEKIRRRQITNHHTMLDELEVMMDFSASSEEMDTIHTRTGEEEHELWLVNRIMSVFHQVLRSTTDIPALIRLAVHHSFFDLYAESGDSDLKHFTEIYLDRVWRFFHRHSWFPDREVGIARTTVLQLLSSGQFTEGRISHMELHLTNNCNLKCQWCTYKNADRHSSLSFKDIQKLMEMKPAEILIAGGGEPTLFKDGDKQFADVIHFLRQELPGTRLRLITNGTFIPGGDWIREVDEISISLDESTKEQFFTSKGADLFERTWKNIQRYLWDDSLTFLRVSKIFSKNTLMSSLPLAEKLYELWQKLPAGGRKQRCFRFMLFPMADDFAPGNAYHPSQLTDEEKTIWTNALLKVRNEEPSFALFLEQQTNLLTVAETPQTECNPDHCWNAANYILAGADGFLYPCFAACSAFQGIHYGPAGCSLKELMKAREELFHKIPFRCHAGCRPGNVFYGLRSKELYYLQKKADLPHIREYEETEKTIVHVSYQDPDHIMGGIGWAVTNLCRQQVRDGYRVYWISPCVKEEQPGEYLYEDGKLRVLKIRFTDQYVETLFSDSYENHQLRMEFGKHISEIITEHFSPENCIIHLHGFIETPAHSKELIDQGYKVVSTFHMLLSARRQHILHSGSDPHYMKEAEDLAIRNNSIITVPAHGMIDELYTASPGYTGRIECIPNGIGNEHFDVTASSLSENEKVIVSYGRISPEKGFDMLIEAAKLYNKANNSLPARFVIFGNTDMNTPARREYAERLQEIARGHDNIQLLISPSGITGEEKIRVIDQATFAVVPSLYEPFGLVIPELMARHKPVITTDTTGAREIMQTSAFGRNDYGFIVRHEPDEIYLAILWLLEHPLECAKMGENAYRRACDYHWEKISKQFAEVYRYL